MKHAPATLRNRDAILDVLREELPETGRVLEVASGSGEHIVYFAANLPDLQWQPSDPDGECRRSVLAWTVQEGLHNISAPLDLNVVAADWPSLDRVEAMLCINMIHIAPWQATEGLFGHAKRLLSSGAPLFLYGPYLRDDVETAPSNIGFDQSLRSRNPAWGIRDLKAVDAVADQHGFARTRLTEMPANNLSLVYRRV